LNSFAAKQIRTRTRAGHSRGVSDFSPVRRCRVSVDRAVQPLHVAHLIEN